MTKQPAQHPIDDAIMWNGTDERQCSELGALEARTASAAYLDLLVRQEEWGYIVRRGLLAAVAMLFSSGMAQAAAGGLPQGVYESAQPHPQWSQAERAANSVEWSGQLFGGSRQQYAYRVQGQSGPGAPVHLL